MPFYRLTLGTTMLALLALLAGACSSTRSEESAGVDIATRMLGRPDASAVAQMRAVPGSRVEGKVTFQQYGSVVVVRASFIGLAPNREYGLHVHERGDCRTADGSAAGGHLNPGGAAHGRPGRGAHHAGDLPNLSTDGDGGSTYVYDTRALAIGSGAGNVIGRSVIISRDPDDYRTQPDGNSGPPLACGFIRPD